MRKLAVLAVAVSLALNAGSARADAYEATMTSAVAARDRAKESHDLHDWDEALRLFLEAARINPNKNPLYEAGVAAQQLKADDVAVDALSRAIALGLTGTAREKAEAFVAANESRMARLDVKGTAGTRVLVAERTRGILPLAAPIVVFAGAVRVRVIAPNGRDAIVDTEAKAGATVVVSADDLLAPKASVEAPKPVVTAPPAAARVSPDANRGWAWAVGAAGLVSIGVGAYFGVRALEKRDDRDALCAGRPQGFCAGDPDVTSLYAEARTNALLANVFVGAGIVAVGVGAYGLLRGPPAPSSRASVGAASLRIEPVALQGGAGLTLGWRSW